MKSIALQICCLKNSKSQENEYQFHIYSQFNQPLLVFFEWITIS